MQTAAQAGMTPIFYTAQVEDVKASREAGRPIFVDQERIEYRFASNRNFNFHDLAHGFHEERNGEVITHAMRFPKEYTKFKETGGNEASGTPLQNLPGLTPIQLSTLKALSVYTIEALASLEGQGIKNLGPQGHALKQSAQKYLAAAGGRVEMTEVLAQLAALQARNDELAKIVEASRPGPIGYTEPAQPAFVAEVDDVSNGYGALDMTSTSEPPKVDETPSPYEAMSDDELKAEIKRITGNGVRGQPSRATLIGMLGDLGVEA